jgi:signal transduction histidine kinase
VGGGDPSSDGAHSRHATASVGSVTRRQSLMDRFAGSHPSGLGPPDWLPVLLLGLVSAVEPWVSGGLVLGPPAATAAAGVVASLLLVHRRRRPLAVLLGVGCLGIAPALIWGASELGSAALILALAVYSCGRHGRRPWAYLAVALGAGMVTLQLALDPLASVASSWVWALNVLWIFLLGGWLRQQAALADRRRAELEAQTAAAAAEQRVRLARDVHDILAHNLAVMLIQADVADELLDTDTVQAHQALAHVHRTGREALTDVRDLLEALHGEVGPGMADVPALVDRLRHSGLPVTLSMSTPLAHVAENVGAVAYRVVQEALTNVVRHAGLVPTDVVVGTKGGRLSLRVQNRSAPPMDEAPVGGPDLPPSGHGLRGMRERVRGRGGTLQAGADDRGGFTVVADMPVGDPASLP